MAKKKYAGRESKLPASNALGYVRDESVPSRGKLNNNRLYGSWQQSVVIQRTHESKPIRQTLPGCFLIYLNIPKRHTQEEKRKEEETVDGWAA
jgi:hypothetical protein